MPEFLRAAGVDRLVRVADGHLDFADGLSDANRVALVARVKYIYNPPIRVNWLSELPEKGRLLTERSILLARDRARQAARDNPAPAPTIARTMNDRSHLMTELRLPESMRLDAMGVEEAVRLMNQQDQKAVEAVGRVAPEIARATELVVAALKQGGRLIYYGAGTSGRLGVLDASECPPTFRVDPDMVQGVIAGGPDAMFRAKEGAEDSAEGGAAAVDEKKVGAKDVVCGIAAGGTTPFVHGALRRAKELGAKTVFVTCVQATANEPAVDVVIRPLVGPEVLTGSTRLKAGTATKLALNSMTTIAMVQLGKCYENLMVDLRASNAKLWERGARIVATLTGLAKDQAMELLRAAEGHVKLAVVMHKRSVPAEEGRRLLERAGGRLREAVE